MIQSYDDLTCYKKSYNMALEIYQMARNFPKEEIYGITSQIRRAALSIPLNIAEGYGKRESNAEFKRFLWMAKGSCDEMKVLIEFCKDIGLTSIQTYETFRNGYDEVGKMLHGLINNWR